MSRDDPQYNLRLPEALRSEIKEAARHNRRSMNAEIVSRLQESLADPVRPTDFSQEINARLARIEKALALSTNS
ncbi:Arc family DNA-binding protein [Salinisphaera sp. T31B1]|uniref:Arc family DNA-binding protein n=1 Tax=Salinisphaera sp. T31B1 TaxID=727963 RepID=UPI0033408566